MKRYFPILTWLPGYDTGMFRGDLAAGLTVGVMLIPQAMAYALIAGMPPVYGLYASLVPLIIYGIMGTSRQLGVGPVAVVSLLVVAGVADFAEPGSSEYIQLAILLAFMVGVIQLLMGLLRMGFMVNFLSHPVITGFTAATALIIAFSQLHHILGISIGSSKHVHTILIQVYEARSEVHLGTVAFGLGAIAAIYAIKRWYSRLPGALVVVVAGIALVAVTGWDQRGIQVIGEVPSGLPFPGLPAFSLDAVYGLLPMAFAITIVGFMESIAVAKSIHARHRDYRLDPNQELVALGSANVGGALFQAFPVTGGFSRSAVNDQAGAKSGMAGIISALLIGLTLLFLTPLFYYLPNAVLGAIIITAVLGLIDIREIRFQWRIQKQDFAMMAITFLVTLVLGIEEGILTGVVASLGVVIFHSSKPHVARLGQLPGTRVYRNLSRFDDASEREDVLVFRYDAPLFYANADHFKETVTHLIAQKGEALKRVVLDASGINSIDTTGIHALASLEKELRDNGIQLRMAAVHGPVRDLLTKSKYFRSADDERLSRMEVYDAVAAGENRSQPA
ncbi:MAG: solute carrier family 26 protein [Cyclonatronaceae bacterium]